MSALITCYMHKCIFTKKSIYQDSQSFITEYAYEDNCLEAILSVSPCTLKYIAQYHILCMDRDLVR